MTITYKEVETKVPHTSMKIRLINGIEKAYTIAPTEGYILHDNAFDTVNLDEETQEEIITLGYREDEASAPIKYNFTPIEMQDEEGNTVTAYGDRKFYCKVATETIVP